MSDLFAESDVAVETFLVEGPMRETAFPASPYSYFEVSERDGLREMWDEAHAAHYASPVKHALADYAAPIFLYRTASGALYVCVKLLCCDRVMRVACVDSRLLRDDPDFVVRALGSALGFRSDYDKAGLVCKALMPRVFFPADVAEGDEVVPVLDLFLTYDSGRVSPHKVFGTGVDGVEDASEQAPEPDSEPDASPDSAQAQSPLGATQHA